MLPIACTTGAFVASYCVARVADQGLAHTLGLTTLRHGTNPLSWLSIHILGFLPQMGASSIGGDAGVSYVHQNLNRVYLAKDAEDTYYYNSNSPFIFLYSRYRMRILPRLYNGCSTDSLLKRICLVNDSKYFRCTRLFIFLCHFVLYLQLKCAWIQIKLLP